MKSLLAVISLAVLGGCAVAPPGVQMVGTRAQAGDPYQWHVVSAVPTQGGAAATVSRPTEYTTEPLYAAAPVYVTQQPVYVTQPLYVPQPYYSQPYYNPIPVTIGFDFMFGGRYGGRHGGGWGGRGGYRGHR